MSDKITRYIKATRATANMDPRKSRGLSQRIYLLRIHDFQERTDLEVSDSDDSSISTDSSCDPDTNDTSDDTSSDDTSSDDTSSDDTDTSDEAIEQSTVSMLTNWDTRKFDLCGTTGNLYTVTINASPSCTCPDHEQRKRRCKHIYFILVRIMGVSRENEDKLEYDQRDLEEMFDNMPTEMTEVTTGKANDDMLNRYTRLTIKTNKDGTVRSQKINSDSRCPVCLDNLKGTKEPTTHCRYGCGSVVHVDCADMFNRHRKKTGYAAVCFVCQKRWDTDDADLDYLNLK